MVWFYPEKVEFSLFPSKKVFQSHYGLILSPFPRAGSAVERSTFNPTMVWFYLRNQVGKSVVFSILSIPLWSDFIIAVERLEKYLKKNFQSHYGLILSKLRNKKRSQQRNRAFNPTMVWFYLWACYLFQIFTRSRLSIPLWSDFIISDWNTVQRVLCPTFNPTMVWFYRPTYLAAYEYTKTFQSHYGLILSSDAERLELVSVELTFNPTMVWFYLLIHSVRASTLTVFQSHYGLILSWRRWWDKEVW